MYFLHTDSKTEGNKLDPTGEKQVTPCTMRIIYTTFTYNLLSYILILIRIVLLSIYYM